ncbi:MAG: signal peptidase I [Bacilli bacterium]|nr:signal peptidase I [Bacilli bacterium]MDD4795736.1 signal peptidase I [Bacilli bacterium]
MNSPKDNFKTFGKSLVYVFKLISAAVLVVLILVMCFLAYYFVSAKILSTQAGGVPKVALYTIVSGSMEPAIKVDDIIFSVRVDDFSTLKIGDVITYKSDSTLIKDMRITHRIIDIKEKEAGTREFITKGDYNPSADPAPIQERDILGKTIFKIPFIGKIQLFLASKIGWLFVVLIPALGVIIFDILKLFKIVGVTEKTENVKHNDPNFIRNEENKKIRETLEKIKKNPLLYRKDIVPEEPEKIDNSLEI